MAKKYDENTIVYIIHGGDTYMNVIQGVSWQEVFWSCFLIDVEQTIPVQCVCSITPRTLHCVDSFCFNLISLLILYKNVASRSANTCTLIINQMLFEQRISYRLCIVSFRQVDPFIHRENKVLLGWKQKNFWVGERQQCGSSC